ncbi:MAG: hypothetical protein IJH53_03220 [Oscillospiraceae bacterium]|nr:hypothetical protein [Oscillospiraceae bacterium]
MERKISWESGCYDGILRVYEKAEKDPAAAAVLRSLEESALEEGNRYSQIFQIEGKVITPDIFPQLPEQLKEQILQELGRKGLSECCAMKAEPVIKVTLSQFFSYFPACTTLFILDMFEQLEQQYRVRFPEAELRLQIPVGSSKDITRLRMMNGLLYPWIKMNGTVTNRMAGPLANSLNKAEE